MSLPPGQRLGPYELLGSIGAGGMGEVYRARDSRLRRDVAIKILPEGFASDPDRLARFDREARLLAALSHPGIAVIHEIGEEKREPGSASSTHYLVMELVDGETLAQKISRGPVPLDEALRIARQIAAALAAAHEKGIVHRDLKPDNVKVSPDGQVKVLDFGLATSAAIEPRGEEREEKPTLTRGLTILGTVLGTPPYMSPEQARGQAVDRRSDLWAFGCVLYEMLTGRRAFEGDTVSDILAAILGREPDWSRLPRSTPAGIRRLLEHCLAKDVERRVRDAGDVRLEIDDALEGLGPRRRSAVPGWAWLLGGALVLATTLAAMALLRRGPSTSTRRPGRLTQVTIRGGIETSPAWSPDGSRIALTSEERGLRRIVVRQLDTGEDKRVAIGDADTVQPAWSADGRTLLFVRSRQPGRRLEPGDVFGSYTDGDLWAVDLASGRETRLAENAFNPAVSPDGTRIAVDASWAGPRRLWVLDAEGRNPQQVSTDASEAAEHIHPRWSPDGRRLVFQHIERTRFDVRVVSLETKAMTAVTNDLTADIDPVWSPSGRYVYFSSPRGGGWNVWRTAVGADGKPSAVLEQITTGAGQDVQATLSRDGRRLAFAILRQNADLWTLPVSRDTGLPTGPPQSLVSTTREDSRGAWSPDGRSVAFNSDRAGDMNIWIRSLDEGAERPLTTGPGGDFQPNWSPDGKTIAFFSSRAGSADIWRVDVASGRLAQLTRGPATEANPCFSPDGTRLAYQSDEGGRLEAWIMAGDGTGARALTRGGVAGHFLRWTRDGRSVVYLAAGGGGHVMTVPADGGEPSRLVDIAGGSHISFSPDFSRIADVVGHKTLWITPVGDGPQQKVFAFDDPQDRIDYPVLSPDGRAMLFDRFRPSGGDIWALEGLE